LEGAVSRSKLALVRLVAPTTPDARLAVALQGAGGFVYLISRLGVTGARADAPPDLDAQVARLRQATSLPIAVGFGITTPEHVRAAARAADGVVVGSALVSEIERAGPEGSNRLVAALAAAARHPE
jgi:tryptophan synthase alpha chain